MTIDLNCDLGESSGSDEAMMSIISSANVACGFHAGDPTMIRQTIRLAKQHGVAVGAHPGFADRSGFGRREMRLAPSAIEDLVLYQVSALAGMAAAEGLRLAHVKPHGALYNLAARDETMAVAIARAVAAVGRDLVLFGLAGSALIDAGRREGLPVAAEAFADRAYEADGSLRARDLPDALLTEPGLVSARAMRIVMERCVVASDGSVVPIEADTICVHGDTPGAVEIAKRIKADLTSRGVRLASPSAGARSPGA